MPEAATTSRTTWPAAALHLAARCTRRERLSVLLPRLATGILAGALPAVLCRTVPALVPFAPLAPWLVLTGAAIGLLLGIRKTRAIAMVAVADAAWALDRVGDAGERGLTAAAVEGPRGAEAAWASPPLAPPPRVRLLPPRGLALFVGAALVAGIALFAVPPANPAASSGDAGPTSDTARSARAAGAAPAAAAVAVEDAAVATEAQGAQAKAIADALDLPSDEPVDPAELAERLTDPELRLAAEEAARGSSLAAAFAGNGSVAERLARALNAALAPDARAERRRREAVALRALDPRAPVPAHRRGVVERYYELQGE